ncbi:MAG: HAMP domain-containing sensor histidine kinase [Actinomycetota bacterium]
MTTSFTMSQQSSRPGERAGPPVGPAFVAFTILMIGLFVLAVAELAELLVLPVELSSQFGVVAVTTFGLSGVLAAYRAISLRNWWAAAIAAVLIGPGATWSWAAFVADGPRPQLAASFIVLAAGVLAVGLLSTGFRTAHWLEVFGGLGTCGLTMVAVLVRFDGDATTATAPALLAAVAGMICLYGLLVDLEVAEHRSLVELMESRKRIEREVSQVEELLHDLRGGLLAIEAAIGSFDGELAAPLRSEAARLRRLTLTGARTVEDFDFADRVENLVATRQAAGVEIELRSPEHAYAWGEESEVLAIVDNLLSNADRHGGNEPIMVEISTEDGRTRLSVRNSGGLKVSNPDAAFTRGITSHPDGQGLGLARARMLADVNGAELRLGPAEAGHTTFVLSLLSRSPAVAA